MPPNIRNSPLSILVTLAPIRGFGDARVITLKPGEPCLIGRASKSNLKDLDPRCDNALFDCPVISREHAELRAHLWDLVENQVTITDKGSMHGTRVNGAKLREGEPKPLRSGDTIQFGERVTRGDSAHEGVVVTFSHRQNVTQESNSLAAHTPATNPSGVYRYPYTSDEESDYDSDVNVSVINDRDEVMEVSSSKTTPEQAKAKLGSQEQPIELDEPEKLKRTMVQDSLDAQASILVPESLPVPHRRLMSNIVDVDSDSDDESVFIKRKAAPRDDDLDSTRAISHLSVEQDVDEPDEFEYPNNDDVENASDGDASKLIRFDRPEESDGEDWGEVPASRSPSPESIKETSPELRSSGQRRPSAPAAPPNMYMPPSATSNSSYNTPFDYDLGFPSQPFGCSNAYPTTFAGHSSLSQPSFFGTSDTGGGARTSLPGTSRWDKLPTARGIAPLPEYAVDNRERYHPPASHQTRVSCNGPAAYANSMFTTTGVPDHQYTPQSAQPTTTLADVNSSFMATGARDDYTPQSPKMSDAIATAAGRISIPDIVENEMVDMDNESSSVAYGDFVEGGACMLEEAKSMVDEANATFEKNTLCSPSASKTGSAGTKRKAVDEEALIQVCESDSPQFISGASAGGFTIKTPHVQKRAKISDAATIPTFDPSLTTTPSTLASAGSIAGSIAKYAAVASAGGAGMLAFLLSPASEQLQNWLS